VPTAESLARDGAVLSELASAGVKLVSDPTVPMPGSAELIQVWWWNGAWRLLPARGGKARELGKSLDIHSLHEIVAGAPTGTALYVNFPLPARDAAALDLGDGSGNDAVRVQTEPDQPRKNQYVLAGRWNGKSLQYAWVRPGITEVDQADTNLPVRTDWVSAGDADCDANLRDKALTLSRIYGWMTLDVPGGGGFSGPFPYRLALRKAGTSGSLAPGDLTRENERYKLWLTANPEEVAALAKTGRIAQRWVYVIVIDRDGNISVPARRAAEPAIRWQTCSTTSAPTA